MLLLKEYLNNKSRKEDGNLTVHTPFLWEQIAKIRGGMPSMRYRTRWKFLAGCSRVKGRHPNLSVVVDGRHYLTPRESAAIVMLALWEGEIREKVDPELGSEAITADRLEDLFDRWMREDVSPEAVKILGLIERSQQLTYEILETSINSDPAKKPIASSTLRGWVENAGGKFRKFEICPLHIAHQVWMKAQDRRMENKSAAA